MSNNGYSAAPPPLNVPVPPAASPDFKKDKQQKRQERKLKIKKALRFKQKRLAMPYGLLIAIFVVIPLIFMIADAFMTKDGSFTLKNFDDFWARGEDSLSRWQIIGDTLSMAFFTTLICLLISYPLALALSKLKSGKRAVLVLLFVAPMWINSLLRIYAIKLIFHDANIYGYRLTLIGMVYDFFPFMLLPIYTSLAGTDSSYFEAAADLGASPIKTLFKVKLPLSKQGIISGIIMVFMPAMSTFAVSGVLGGSFVMFGNLIEGNVGSKISSAYSMVLLVIMAIVFIIANRFATVKNESRTEGVL